MAPTVLFELFNSTLPQGTGIATYSRVLCGVAADLGYRTEGLLHTDRPLNRSDDVLTEIDFFDAHRREPAFLVREAVRRLHRTFGLPGGFRPIPLPRGGVVIGPDRLGPLLSGLDEVHVARRFMEYSRFHFRRYRRCSAVRLRRPPDIFHTTQAIPLYVPGARNIYTVHDLVPLRLPYSTLDDKRYVYAMVRHLGRVGDRIVTVSEASRRDLMAITGIPGEKIVNTYQAVSFPPAATAPSAEEAGQLVERSFGLVPGGYYLFYGALEPKKNVGRLVDAFAASGTRRPLVIAGGLGWQYEADLEKIAERKVGPRRLGRRLVQDERIRRLQYVPLDQLVALIRSARALVFPSIYEGFGLPVLEAMLLGTPVITSRTSALGEVAGDAALLVDPLDTADIMRAIQRIDRDDALCATLRAKGLVQAERFSVAAYRDRLGRVYESLLHPEGPAGG